MVRVLTAALLAAALLPAGCKAPGHRPAAPPSSMGANGSPEPGSLLAVPELEEMLRNARAEGRRGIPCTGLSVFEGVEIETFEAEIVDVIKNFVGPKRDVILARLKPSHPVVAKAGVIAGMSGSPMYVGGRMIGALAYGWSWAREPLIGITPIHDMIEDGRRQSPEIASAPIPVPTLGGSGLERIRTPLMVSGLGGRAMEKLQKDLEGLGVSAMPAGRGSSTHPPPGPLRPGSAIGATLCTGDVDFTGIGTVTYVDKDLVLAFGHPFFGEGPFEMPITTAVVHTVFASLARSFKVASPIDSVGGLVQDRTACIAGILGRKPKMVPAKVTLNDRFENFSRTIQVEILDHPRWLPMILNYAAMSAEEVFAPSNRPRTVVSNYAVRLSNGQELRFEEVTVTNPQGWVGAGSAGGDTFSKLLQILRNPFEKVGVESIEVAHEYLPEMRSGQIKAAWPVESEVKEGGTATVRLRLEHWRAKESTLDVEVPLPPEARTGEEVTIEIAGAPAASLLRPPYTNLEQMIEVLKRELPATHVVATVHLAKLSFSYRGTTLERVPGSVIAQLVPGLGEPAIVSTTPVRVTREVERVLLGSARVTVKVR
jgi:hypothetical protein